MFAKAFRLFVSSTFQDFGEERRLLQERVFPALEAHCAKDGFGFRAVDMRWGVNDDAQHDQRTAEICLGEVIEAKGYPAPNLLILIGNRYGWTPLPFAIARDEFEAVRQWLVSEGHNEAVSDLDRVYALDENHLHPIGLAMADAALVGAYTLRSREDDLIALQAAADWEPVEARLRDALQTAARQLNTDGQLRDAELQKYMLSLTEQEIRKGLDQLSECDGAAAANSVAWVRTTETAEPAVRSLADAVQRALPEGNVLHAGLQAGSDGYADHFVEQITAKLIAAIDVQIADLKTRAQAPDFPLRTERAIHEAFAAERLGVFIGRASNLAAIAAHIASESRHPLMLTGISGSGKTALMAKAAAETKGKVVQRFVGASASSANQRNLLISIVEDLAALGVASLPEQWEDDDSRFVNQVRDLLSALDQPLAIFIDAIDQLRAPYRPMWLPPQLPPQVKLIVSVLDDEAFSAERTIIQGLRRSLPAEAFLAIEPLSRDDGADIIAGLKREAQRGLSPDQEAYILERFEDAGASPLYLRIAFAIARRWRSTDDPRARGLAGDVTALISQFLDELSNVHHHEPLLVRRALGLIAAGREGLSEIEAIAVLSRDAELMAVLSSERFGAVTDRLPDSVWVRLKRSLAAFLVEKGEDGEPLISFFHRQVTQVVRSRFYEPEKAALHRTLAAYFDPPAEHPNADPPWTRRGFIELPFQLFYAGVRDRLDALLTDPAWIDLKLQQFRRTSETIADYNSFVRHDDMLGTRIGNTLRHCSSIIRQDPRQAMVQLHGRLFPYDYATAFVAQVLRRIPDGALIHLSPVLATDEVPVLRLFGHNASVTALAAMPNDRLASGSADRTVRVWDLSGISETIVLNGHSERVTALTCLSNGLLVSGSEDGTIRIWDPDTARQAATISVRTQVHSLAALDTGQFVAATDNGVLICNAEGTYKCISGSCPTLLSLAPNGSCAVNDNKSIILVDPLRGEQLAFRRNVFRRRMMCLLCLPSGEILVGSSLGTMTTLSQDRLRIRRRFSVRGKGVYAVATAALSSGCVAIGGADSRIRVWDKSVSRIVSVLAEHAGGITALATLPRDRIVSGSSDQTIRIWPEVLPTVRNAGARNKLNSPYRKPPNLFAPGSHTASSRTIFQRPVTHMVPLSDGRIAFVLNPSPPQGGVSAYTVIVCPSQPEQRVQLHSDGVLIELSDGRVACADGKSVRVYCSTSGLALDCLFDLRGTVTALAAMPNECVAIGYADGPIEIWDMLGKAAPVLISGHAGSVTALVRSQMGTLVSGSTDGTIRVWDPSTAQQIAQLTVGTTVKALATLPSGQIVAATPGAIYSFDLPGDKRTFLAVVEPSRDPWLNDSLHSGLALFSNSAVACNTGNGCIQLIDLGDAKERTQLIFDEEIAAVCGSTQEYLIAVDVIGQIHWIAKKNSIHQNPTEHLRQVGLFKIYKFRPFARILPFELRKKVSAICDLGVTALFAAGAIMLFALFVYGATGLYRAVYGL